MATSSKGLLASGAHTFVGAVAAFGVCLSSAPSASAQQAAPGTGYAQPGYAQPGYAQPGYAQPTQPGYAQPGYAQPGYAQPTYAAPGYAPASSKRARDVWEIGTLYGVSAAYGAGMGIWISSEFDIEDPGVFLIPPAVLTLAGPVGVFFLDRNKLQRGMPLAITTGMVIGTANATGFVIHQHASKPDADAWGFEELTRATAIGSTLGAAGGFAAGYYLEPPPESGLLVTSGVLWGAAVGAMFGYGASAEDKSYGEANESAALGGLIGLNVGMAATGALTAAVAPSLQQIGSMWLGAGIGAAVSAPIYLLYVGDDKPPAKRGLLFTGTTTTLGLIGGAVFGSGKPSPIAARQDDSGVASLGSWGKLDYVAPQITEDSVGLALGGRLE